MRVVIVTSSAVAALLLAGWAAGGSPLLPPKCSPANTQRGAILSSAGWGTDDQPGYARYCGPARAVVRVGGKAFTFSGHCTSQRARFGVLWNGIGTAPPGRGFWVLLQGGRRAGRNEISDGELQLNGRVFVPKGTAIVSKSLERATFSLLTSAGKNVTGSWTCGAGSPVDITKLRAAFKKRFGPPDNEAPWYSHITAIELVNGRIEITTDLGPESDGSAVARAICGAAAKLALDLGELGDGIKSAYVMGLDGVGLVSCA